MEASNLSPSSYTMGCHELELELSLSIVSTQLLTRPLLIVVPDLAVAARLQQGLRFFLSKKSAREQVITLPALETLPYDNVSPAVEVSSRRMAALAKLLQQQFSVLLVDVVTLLHRLPPLSYITNNLCQLQVGQRLDTEVFQSRLRELGYRAVSEVLQPGEFCVNELRIDLFPMGSRHPYRLGLEAGTLAHLQTFNVETQRSEVAVDRLELLPVGEMALTEEGVKNFILSWQRHFSPETTQEPLYTNVVAQRSYPGLEYYLPLFFTETATLFDYLPAHTQVVTYPGLDWQERSQEFWEGVLFRYQNLELIRTGSRVPPAELFLSGSQLAAHVARYESVKVSGASFSSLQSPYEVQPPTLLQQLSALESLEARLAQVKALLLDRNKRLLLVSRSVGRREVLLKLLQNIGLFPIVVQTWSECKNSHHVLSSLVDQVRQSLHFKERATGIEFIILNEEQLLGSQLFPESASPECRPIGSELGQLGALSIGAPVVHINYGIGRYLGLQKLELDGTLNEFMVLGYEDESKLYVPITDLSLVHRYTGLNGEYAPLDRLGSKQWEHNKQQAEKIIHDVAVEILEIHSRRQQTTGWPFTYPAVDYAQFAADFAFTPTTDQQKAIDAVLEDLQSQKVMDRLICGDVGFGKTEVAMRAAFLAIWNGKQVAVLTPTTILAKQHYDNFRERFARWPVKIALCSRFVTAKEQEGVLAQLAQGEINIIIATHKLLQPKVKFKALGLLIIDEEHRFGVKHKEYIKKVLPNINILALTATPIPRTLSTALAGLRDFSIIATPPAKRLAIKTFVAQSDQRVIQEVILRELARGGQVYFLHNDITSLPRVLHEIKELVPHARVDLAHGQMPKRELGRVMQNFYEARIDILICTTIIESGIDIPTANTMLIDRADTFGLAQLHQLRGRIGRAHHQAYAYLLVPPLAALSSESKQRLEVFAQMKDLGAGFSLAMNDLEIRGAGEILGEKQSGVIKGIGFDLYLELLNNSVQFLKSDTSLCTHHPVEIEVKSSLIIPDSYIPDINLRLIAYKRLAAAPSESAIDLIQAELIDRFGLMPSACKDLFTVTRLKLIAQPLGIKKIGLQASTGQIEFIEGCSLDVNLLVSLLREVAEHFSFKSGNLVVFTFEAKKFKPLVLLESLLSSLAIKLKQR